MATYGITEWSEHQHYKDRDPTWVKLYQKTLTSITWLKADLLARTIMLASLLLAARYRNAIPIDEDVLIPALAPRSTKWTDVVKSLRYLHDSNFLQISEDDGLALTRSREKEAEEEKEKRKTKGARLEPDWKPSEEDRAYARGKNLTDAEVDEEGVAFVRYWTGPDAKNAAKRDWHRTWCNRIDDASARIIGRRPKFPIAAASPEPATPRSINRVEWTAYVRAFRKTKGAVWPSNAGPKPGDPSCWCPRDVIEEVDLDIPDFMARKPTVAA